MSEASVVHLQDEKRRTGRLGRRIALVLLPLVLLPILLMGGAAYLRTREILIDQARQQLISAAQGQAATLENWSNIRQRRLSLGSQRSALREAVAELVAAEGNDELAVEIAQTAASELVDLRTQQGVVLFSDLFVVGLTDGSILASTNESWVGQRWPRIDQLPSPDSLPETLPVHQDPLLVPDNVALLNIVPMRAAGARQVDSLLVGVSSDLRLASLMEEIQAFWEQRGAYRVERGGTFLAVSPDVIVELPRYATVVESHGMADHPVFQLAAEDPSGSANYTGLDGAEVFGAYEWISEWGLGVVVELPQAVVFADLNSLAPFMLALVAGGAALTFLVVILATNQMLRPLANLTEFAARLSRGEWGHRVPEDREDELGELARSFNLMAKELRGMYGTLEDRVEERTRQIRTASQVARAVISTPTLDDLLRRAVELIRDQFGYYHVSIFLLDEDRKFAEIRESTGEVGKALKARNHKLEVGSQSIIGWVTENNQYRVATDVTEDPVHFRNELLPETRSEAAVPLQVGGRVLGALDVQSTEPEAFQEEDIEILQTLADQLSAAIQNAYLAETSMMAAERSRTISEVTRQLSGLLEVEKVLETAAQSLHRNLGEPEIVVKLREPMGDGPVDEHEPEEGTD